jgi:hypothetical protein
MATAPKSSSDHPDQTHPPEPTKSPAPEKEPAVTKTTVSKSSYQLTPPSLNESISYESAGPIRDENNRLITNDHSILTDVAGQQVWLHNEKHHHSDGRVHMPISHAIDMGLPTPYDEHAQDAEPKESFSAGSQQHPPHADTAAGGTDGKPATQSAA